MHDLANCSSLVCALIQAECSKFAGSFSLYHCRSKAKADATSALRKPESDTKRYDQRAIATKDGSDPLFRDLGRVEANATVMANPHCQLDTLGERKSQLKNSCLRLYCGHVSGDIFLISGYWKGSFWSTVVVPSLCR